MPAGAHWRGLRGARDAIRILGEEGKKVFFRQVREEGERVLTEAKDTKPGQGVPVDEGTLRSTGRVEVRPALSMIEVHISFGGPAAPYALVQHEDLTLRHTVGEAKYLERALDRVNRNNAIEKRTGVALVEALRKSAR